MADPIDFAGPSYPLSRVVLCCTSIPPDVRQEIARKAQDMGARHVLDLTTEVTHLICGELYTPKYKYVAKMRADVKVMRAEWMDAMYGLWRSGEDIDPASYEFEHRMPTLMGLRISVTGIADVAERKKIEELVQAQAASYHPDLTKHATHLIAAAPTGKKYEFAVANGIRIVTPEWLNDSLERGLALEEEYYDPRLPRDKIGVGAMPLQPTAPAAEIGVYHGKRKLRKAISAKLGSQSQTLWDSIVDQAAKVKPIVKRDEWEAAGNEDRHEGELSAVSGIAVKSAQAASAMNKGMFAGCLFYVHGFEGKKETTVNSVLSSNGGKTAIALHGLDVPAYSRRFIVVPHVMQRKDCPTVPDGVTIVTEWFIEMCLHKTCLVEPSEHLTTMPFENLPLEGFGNLEICLTRFSGVELLHYGRLIGLMGATFQESLTKKRSLLITNTSAKDASGEKLYFAVDNDIPIVTLAWLQECLKQSKCIPYDGFIVTRRKRAPVPDESADKKGQADVETVHENSIAPPKFPLGDKFKKRKSDVAAALVSNKKYKAGDRDGDAEDLERQAIEKGNEPQGFDRSGSVGRESGSKGIERNKILSGLVVCISKQLKDCKNELSAVASAMGASVVDNFSSNDAQLLTHFLHTSTTGHSREIGKDVRAAKSVPGCVIVSPDWLYSCQRAGKRMDERSFPSLSTNCRPLGSHKSIHPAQPPPGGISTPDPTQELQHAGMPEERSSSLTTVATAPLADLNNFLGPSRQPTCSMDPPDNSAARATVDIGEILDKFGKEKLTQAMDKSRKPRGRLQGRAMPGMPSLNSSLGLSRASSASPTPTSVPDSEHPNNSTMSMEPALSQEPPQATQKVSYAYSQAETERESVRARLEGSSKQTKKAKRQIGAATAATEHVAGAVEVAEANVTARRRSKRQGG